MNLESSREPSMVEYKNLRSRTNAKLCKRELELLEYRKDAESALKCCTVDK